MTKELSIEKKSVKDAQKTLEEEILQRVTAENKLQSLRENFKFKEEVKMIMIFWSSLVKLFVLKIVVCYFKGIKKKNNFIISGLAFIENPGLCICWW